jgi:chromosome segregation ATPase
VKKAKTTKRRSDMSGKNGTGHRMTTTERNKAEQMIRGRYADLETAVSNEASRRKTEIVAEFTKTAGVEKLEARLKKKREELSKVGARYDTLNNEVQVLRDEIDAMNTGQCGYRMPERVEKMLARLTTAKAAIESAAEDVKLQLRGQMRDAVEQLWLGALTNDALGLIKAVPTVEQLKKGGLAVLGTSTKKLLSLKKG